MSQANLSASEATWLLSREIRHLQHRLERLETGLEHVYADGDERLGTVAITAFQELDMLVQSTDALAAYIERLSRRLDQSSGLDLADELGAIPLRELAARLGGAKTEPLVPNVPEMF